MRGVGCLCTFPPGQPEGVRTHCGDCGSEFERQAIRGPAGKLLMWIRLYQGPGHYVPPERRGKHRKQHN
jgi:hypothetical protein